MKREDLQAITKDLQNVHVQLPLHQKALREQLLVAHTRRAPAWRQRYCSISMLVCWAQTRAGVAKRVAVPLCIALATIVVLLGLLLLLPSGRQPSSEKFIAKAPPGRFVAQETTGNNSTACDGSNSCSATARQDHEPPPAARGAGATSSPDAVSHASTAQEQVAYVVPGSSVETIVGVATSRSATAAIDETVISPLGEPIAALSIDVHIGTVGDILTGKDKPNKEKALKEDKPPKGKAAKAE